MEGTDSDTEKTSTAAAERSDQPDVQQQDPAGPVQSPQPIPRQLPKANFRFIEAREFSSAHRLRAILLDFLKDLDRFLVNGFIGSADLAKHLIAAKTCDIPELKKSLYHTASRLDAFVADGRDRNVDGVRLRTLAQQLQNQVDEFRMCVLRHGFSDLDLPFTTGGIHDQLHRMREEVKALIRRIDARVMRGGA